MDALGVFDTTKNQKRYRGDRYIQKERGKRGAQIGELIAFPGGGAAFRVKPLKKARKGVAVCRPEVYLSHGGNSDTNGAA